MNAGFDAAYVALDEAVAKVKAATCRVALANPKGPLTTTESHYLCDAVMGLLDAQRALYEQLGGA